MVVQANARKSAPKLRVGFVLTHNFTLNALAIFVDMLRLAADEGDRSCQVACEWHVMNPGLRPVRSSCGVELTPTTELLESSKLDFIVVVGGLLHDLRLAPGVAEYLVSAAERGTTLVGISTGSFILCSLGLMQHRKCCVNWYHYRDFVERYTDVVPVADRQFVVDGDRITAPGGFGVAHLTAHIIAERIGSAAAQKALNVMLLCRALSSDSPQPAPQPSVDSSDHLVARALLLMEQNISKQIAIPDLASRLNVSVRKLERHFRASTEKSPHEIYLDLRLNHGRWLLKNSNWTSTIIAIELGFADAAHFSRAFKIGYGMTPSEYRKSVKCAIDQVRQSRAADQNNERRIFE